MASKAEKALAKALKACEARNKKLREARPAKSGAAKNSKGLTLDQWRRIAELKPEEVREGTKTHKAWLRGEDPLDWIA